MRSGLVLAVCAFLASCDPDSIPAGTSVVPERTVVAPVDTMVSTASSLLAVAADLHVHPDGRLLVTDVLNHVVQIFGPDGGHIGTLGRQGQGPGEFMLPTGLQTRGDSILVVDDGNQRIQVFTSEGEAIESRTWPGVRAPVIGPNGTLAQPTLGMDSVLAVIRHPNGEELTRIGTPLAAATPVIRMTELKDQIENGEVPGIFLNTATALIDDEDAVWLLISAAARIERYSPAGDRLVSLDLDEPEFASAWSEFVRRNRESEPNQVFQLQYLRDAEIVGQNLWILLPSAEEGNGASVVVLSRMGEIVERIRFPQVNGAGSFTVDEARDAAYFFIPEDATLVRVALN
jgi:hypothetical protein